MRNHHKHCLTGQAINWRVSFFICTKASVCPINPVRSCRGGAVLKWCCFSSSLLNRIYHEERMCYMLNVCIRCSFPYLFFIHWVVAALPWATNTQPVYFPWKLQSGGMHVCSMPTSSVTPCLFNNNEIATKYLVRGTYAKALKSPLTDWLCNGSIFLVHACFRIYNILWCN